MEKVKIGEDGSWIWAAGVDANGYGKFWINGHSTTAHRAAWILFMGPIADDLEVDHACHNRDLSCPGGPCAHRLHVNPGLCLEATTSRENTLRGRTGAAANVLKTHCIRDHPFDEANTYWAPNGSRKCRACRDAATRLYRATKRSEASPL